MLISSEETHKPQILCEHIKRFREYHLLQNQLRPHYGVLQFINTQ